MRLLLDTNAYSELARGNKAVAELVRSCTEILFSPVVAGELLYGFKLGNRYEDNRRDLKHFLASPYVKMLTISCDTSVRFAQIMASLRSKGTPIPSNDIWIAAQALETGAEVLSFDEHFALVDGLSWIHPG